MNSENNIEFFKEMFDYEYNKLSVTKKIYDYNENDILIKKVSKTISEDNYNIINDFIKSENINIKSFFTCIYGYILSKYSNQDLIFTSFINENNTNDNENNNDNNINNVQPLLINYRNKQSLNIVLEDINNYLLQYEKQNISYSDISHLFSLSDLNNGIILNNNLEDITDNSNNINEKYTYLFNFCNFDFVFYILANNVKNNYCLSIYYNDNKYDEYIFNNILSSVIEIVRNIDNLNKNINSIEYVPSEEKNKILNDFNHLNYEVDESKICHVEFSKIARANPDKVAIIYRDTKYYYGQLDDMSNSLAYTLRSKGIQRNDIVPVICERSPYYVISILSITKAGGAFTFIDPDFSKERIQSMIDSVKPKIILKYVENEKDKHDVYYDENKKVIPVYYLDQHHYEQNTSELANINELNDLFCVYFTSGSTGKPKGVMISQRNMVNFNYHSQTWNGVDEVFKVDYSIILSFARFTFIMCIREIYGSLFRLKTTILCDSDEFNDPTALGNLIMKYHVEYLTCTHSRVNTYLSNEAFRKSLKEIKVLYFGGENIKPDFLRRIVKYTDAAVFNSLGLTENTGLALIERLDVSKALKARILPIGYPNCNCNIYVLDNNLNPVPIGVEGEMYIAGDGITKGYLNQEELTRPRYLKCPFKPNMLMYKTGDLCQWTSDGRIICNGRNDFQIKIRGQRVEMGEIENTVKEIKGITYCLIVGKTNKDNGENYLICYYILNSKEANNKYIGEKEIRDYLMKKLPIHMIPSYFIRIDKIPLNMNGKLNRKDLPEPNLKQIIMNTYCPPETETEEKLCKIYKKVFHIKDFEIGRLNEFYQLGGNSFNAIETLSLIERELGIKLSIKDIYSHSVVKDLAQYIDKLLNDEEKIMAESYKAEIIKKSDVKEFPITSQQLGVYIDSLKDRNSLIYNNPSSIQLKKSVDISKVKETFLKIFDEHEILKCKFYGKVVQGKSEIYGCMDPDCKLVFENYNLENAHQFVRPFDLNETPLIRVGFVEESKILLIDIHHIISDGITAALIKRELNNYYYNGKIEKLEVQFSDYALHLNEKLIKGYYEKQISFYEEMFKEKNYDLLNIPTKENTFTLESIKSDENINGTENIPDEEKKDEKNNNIAICTKNIDKSMSSLINQYVKNHEITRSALFISIYGYLLSKYSGQEVVYSSIVTTNHNSHYTKNMIGMFASTQPLLLKYNREEESFLTIIKNNMDLLFNVYNNQDLSFSELSNRLKLKNINNAFIFQPKNNTNLNNFGVINNIFAVGKESTDNSLNLSDSKLNDYSRTKFDIICNVFEKEESYLIYFEYNKDLYDSKMIDRIADSFVEVIKSMDFFDKKTIKDLEYINSEEKDKILYEFNDNHCEYDDENISPYHVQFSKVAKANPTKGALVCNGIEITFKQLDEMSNSLANYLRNQAGVHRGDVIPIICERSIYYVIGFLGIMKSGATYLPIDPDYPKERIEYMVEEVGAKFILKYITDGENNEKVKFNNVTVYDLQHHNYKENSQDIDNINAPDDLCYIIFTSGTTGKPKGTLISHKNLINYSVYSQTLNGKEDVFGKDFDNVLAFSKYTFDMSVGEIHYPLLRGCRVVMCNDEEFNNPNLLGSLILQNDVKYLFTVPSRIENYMKDEVFKKSIKNIKWMFIGGERWGYKIVRYINEYSPADIFNVYGPTETTVICSLNKIGNLVKEEEKEKETNTKKILGPFNIGKPLCNYQIYLLDRFKNPVPIGVEGEIYISGNSVGKGYLHREDLTNEKFVDCPFNSNATKMYRTGDLGKWTEDGEIIYVGRIDFQVKVNGQRIELGEIESTMKGMKSIDHSIVIDRVKEGNNGQKQTYLICYYMSSNNKITKRNIRQYLEQKLPLYMVPSYFKKIEKIPLTNNGKLDVKALPEPNLEDLIKEEYVVPTTDIEIKLCEIYSKLFNISSENKIGKMHDFNDIGGNSFNAIEVCILLEKELNIKLSIKDILTHSVISDLASFIEEILTQRKKIEGEKINNISSSNSTTTTAATSIKKDFHNVEVVEKRNEKEFPVTSQQLGVYIDSIKNENSTIYNIPMSFKLNKKSKVNIQKIKKAFLKLFNEQEILKSKYEEREINGETKIYGFIDESSILIFEYYTFDDVNSFVRPFKLSKSPLIRVGFVKDEYLLIDMHHIISDGMSMNIVIDKINQYYYEEKEESDILSIQFSDYAIYLNEKKNEKLYESQISFYEELFKEDYDILNIPTKESKKERKEENESENEMEEKKENHKNNITICSQNIDKTITSNIHQYIKNNELSISAFFISIYGYVLSKYSGQDVIYTAIITANRNSHYIKNMIGMFASTQPLLLNYNKEEQSFLNTIKDNKDLLLNVYNNQDISFSELTQQLKLKNVNNCFVFQPKSSSTYTTIENSIILPKELNNSNNNEFIIPEEDDDIIQNRISKFDIICNIDEKEESYTINLEYNNDLYDSNLMNRIIKSFVQVIKNMDYFDQRSIRDLEYMESEEKKKVLYEFNGNHCEFNNESNPLYHVQFSKVAKTYPAKCALACSGTEITYKQLDEMSNSLAYYLRNQIGIRRGDIIPIICERSIYYVIGFLGVMKSGATYLPIDPEFPKERIKYIIRDVNANFILKYITNGENNEKAKFDGVKEYALQHHNYNENCQDIENINVPDDTCYSLFTSGTTGKPKGTLISHKNLINYCLYSQTYNNGKDDVFGNEFGNALAFSKYTFDMSVGEIHISLLKGSKIVMCNDEEFNDPKSISSLILKNDIKYLFSVPSRIENYMNDEDFKKSLKNIKWMYFGGERLSYKTVRYINEYSSAGIFNGYGPTETTVIISLNKIDNLIEKEKMEKSSGKTSEHTITIGKPLCNCQIYILDRFRNPVPVGVEGEIYISGYSVGKGYLNREELTNEKFVDCPFNSKATKMYRTGDLGKWTENGEIIYMGRIDFQVKVNGQRIELGEIENIMKEMKSIEHAIVINHTKEENKGQKRNYLIGYFISSDDKITGRNIRQYLEQKLPLFMVPSYYKKLESIPLTSNGKLDVRALPEPDLNEEYIAPETETEKMISKIYSNVFGIPENKIGKNSYFYELGGDSFSAIRIVSEIKKQINTTLQIKDIMNYSTVESLSTFIDTQKQKNEDKDKKELDSLSIIPPTHELIKRVNPKEYSITSHFAGMYYDHDLLNLEFFKKLSCNLFVCYKLKDDIDIDKLEKAFNVVFERHSILRTNFVEKDIPIVKSERISKKKNKTFFKSFSNAFRKIIGKKKHKYNDKINDSVSSSSSLSSLSLSPKKKVYFRIRDGKDELKIEHYTIDNFLDFFRRFDLSKDIVIRVGTINNSILMIDCDHRILDAYSYHLIISEVNRIYYDNDMKIEKEPIQHGDYSLYYEEKMRNNGFNDQLEFYKKMFSRPFKNVKLTPHTKNGNDNKHHPLIQNLTKAYTDTETFNNVNNICKKYGLSKPAFFLTIFCLLINYYFKENNLFVNIVNSTRNDELSLNLIGLMLRNSPVLVQVKENISLIDLIREVMNISVNIYEHNLPYSIIKEELNLPKPRIFFKYDFDGLLTDNDTGNNKSVIENTVAFTNLCKTYHREDLLPQAIGKLLRAADDIYELFFYDDHYPSASVVVAENKDNYSFDFSNIDNRVLDEFIENFLYIIKNEKFFKEDQKISYDDLIKTNTIYKKYYEKDLNFELSSSDKELTIKMDEIINKSHMKKEIKYSNTKNVTGIKNENNI